MNSMGLAEMLMMAQLSQRTTRRRMVRIKGGHRRQQGCAYLASMHHPHHHARCWEVRGCGWMPRCCRYVPLTLCCAFTFLSRCRVQGAGCYQACVSTHNSLRIAGVHNFQQGTYIALLGVKQNVFIRFSGRGFCLTRAIQRISRIDFLHTNHMGPTPINFYRLLT